MNRMIRGFTLVELMIVIAILAITIAIGYPAYRDQVMKSRRAEGMGQLLELADRMERFYANQVPTATYNGASLGAGDGDVYQEYTEKGNYQLVIDSATTTLFQISADPVGPQDDDKCGKFTLTSTGQKSAEGGNECWKI